jgi:hypothetical protein
MGGLLDMTYSASDEPQRVYRLTDRLWAETASELVRTDLPRFAPMPM